MELKKTEPGFSLIELLIVVAIIGIIAAIAIPNLLASKRAANEGSAVSSLRTIGSAEATYQSTKGVGEYGTLAELRNEALIDAVLGTAPNQKSGYTFAMTALPPSATDVARFDGTAEPANALGIGATGTRSFYISEIGVIYYQAGGTAPMADATTRVVTPNTPIK